MNNHHYAIIINLIGGFNPSEKYESQLGFTIPNWMESHKIHVPKFPNHQPDIYIYMYIHHVHPFSSFWTIQKTSKNIDDESHEIPVPPGIPASVVRLVLGLVHHCSRSPSPSRSPAETPMAMAGRDSWTISTAMADQKWVSYQPVILYRSIYIYICIYSRFAI